MKIIDLLDETRSALTVNKVRSFLTILGIVIGIGSVIAMISIGQGAQKSIESSIESLGSNLLVVVPGSQSGFGSIVRGSRGGATTLTTDDADALALLEGVKNVAPEYSSRYQVIAQAYNTNTNIIGTVPAYTSVKSITVEEGVFISDQNQLSRSRVAVLGPTTRDDLFGEGASALGQQIRINNIVFTVIGVTESKGGTGFSNSDDVIYIPLSSMQQYVSGQQYVSTINIEAENPEIMADLEVAMTELLLTRHRILANMEADFSVVNQADIIDAVGSTTETFTILLGAVAGISLVVGGIGIMNMMLTTVTERTKEIGLRKAIGARRRDISTQFLMEAILLTGIGGIVGVLVGWGLSTIVNSTGVIATDVSGNSVLLAFSVAALIGIVFGYYPARRASRLNPIDALRYE